VEATNDTDHSTITSKNELDDDDKKNIMTPPFSIIDCIMYNGEPILSARLEILNSPIDRFISQSPLSLLQVPRKKSFTRI